MILHIINIISNLVIISIVHTIHIDYTVPNVHTGRMVHIIILNIKLSKIIINLIKFID